MLLSDSDKQTIIKEILSDIFLSLRLICIIADQSIDLQQM